MPCCNASTSMTCLPSTSRPPTWFILLLILQSFLVSAVYGAGSSSNYEPTMKYPRLHGFLMWASLGLCMPVGIIVVRFMKGAINRGDSTRTIQALAYSHFAIQIVAVILCILGGSFAFANFGREFRYTHERLGLSLFITTCAMPIIGLLRPERGQPFRPFWYALHWLVGTGTVILGFVNIYIGMHVYELISSKSLRNYNILFSIQIAVMGLIYLAQDRWSYLLNQGHPPTKPLTSWNSGPPRV